MGRTEVTGQRRSTYFSSCMSPSCIPVHEDYSRIPVGEGTDRSRRYWRKLVKRIAREGKNIYGTKPTTFQYDAVSYAQNFDEGCHKEEYYVVRWSS